MKILNRFMKNKKLLFNSEMISFDSDGVADVDDKKGKGLIEMKNYEEIQDETQSDKKPKGQEDSETEKAKLEALNVTELKELAKEKGIDTSKLSTKPALIEAIQTAETGSKE